MKTAYFDCFSGISGDMIIGAFLDLGIDIKQLEDYLKKLNLPGFSISAEKVMKTGISGIKFHVNITDNTGERHLKDIVSIIKNGSIDEDIKEAGIKIFHDIAEVEASIHQKSIDEIHFHELSGLDTIVDIIGALYCIKALGIEKIYCSPINTGKGFVKTMHGMMPIPAPATAALLKDIPTFTTNTQAELATPTGAAIIKHICKNFTGMPRMKVHKIGYGAGSKSLDIPLPNLLRIMLSSEMPSQYDEDDILLLQTNIDDMNPEFFDSAIDKILSAGAVDVFITPIFMKKNRPAFMLSALCENNALDAVLSSVFAETTTLGVRISTIRRKKLNVEFMDIKTSYGMVKIKIGKSNGKILNFGPEYEECKKLAQINNVPVKTIYDEAKSAALSLLVS